MTDEPDTLFDVDIPTHPWPDRPRFLMSYAYAKTMTGDDFDTMAHADVIIDSGAFTVANSGKTIDHDAYLSWLAEHASSCRHAFALDVIGDHVASTRNWLTGRDRLGDTVHLIPTWHVGTPFAVFEDYCARTDYVSVGGAVKLYRNQPALRSLMIRLHQIAADHGTRLHGLGLTGRRVMREFPWASVDSSSWAISARLPYLYLANERGRLVSITLGRPMNDIQTDLITRYGGDPAGMEEEGWSMAGTAGEDVARARKTWAVRASARAYMHVEATKPRDPGADFRLYLATSPRDADHITAAHDAGSPYPTDGPSTPDTHTLERITATMPTTTPDTTDGTRPKAIVVCSGGLDSTTLVARYHQTHDVTVLSFNYGQRHVRELESARAVAAHYRLDHLIVDLQPVGAHLRGSSLTDPDVDVPEGHYTAASMTATVVPNRNAIMANIAEGIAIARGASVVALGVHAGDHAVYPDCRPEFITALNTMLRVANAGTYVPVEAPFVHRTKADIVSIGVQLQAPLGLSWSCYAGGDTHCGRCGTCVERAEAFHVAGVADPTTYADPWFWQQAVKDHNEPPVGVGRMFFQDHEVLP